MLPRLVPTPYDENEGRSPISIMTDKEFTDNILAKKSLEQKQIYERDLDKYVYITFQLSL